MQVCDVTFFNVSELVVQSAIDIIYGKEILFPAKDKNKLTWFLNKLGVKWSDGDTLEENAPTAPSSSSYPTPISSSVLTTSTEATVLHVSVSEAKNTLDDENVSKLPMVPPSSSKSNKKTPETELKSCKEHKVAEKDVEIEEDFYAILDKFTETSDEELSKIAHMLIGENGKPDRRYKCLKCPKAFKFFTQAERHHLEHEHDSLSSVRETLRKAELERVNDAQNIGKIEKGIGKVDKKKLMRALRSMQLNFLSFFLFPLL